MKALIRPAIVMTMLIMALNVSAQPPQGRGGRQQMTHEERAKQRVEQLKNDLALNEVQEKQVYDLQMRMSAEMDAMRNQGQRMDREQMMAAMEKRRSEESAAMQQILTKEQFEKWQTIESERQSKRGGRNQEAPGDKHDKQSKKDKKTRQGKKDRKDTDNL